MTYAAIEISEYFRPIELYHFSQGAVHFYFTSSDKDVVFEGNTYIAEPFRRSSVSSTQDIGKTPLKINTSIRNAFVKQFIASPPTEIINITVTRKHAAEETFASTFIGRVINVELQDNGATITCQSIQSSLRRPGLRRLYQTTCPHVLYGTECLVARPAFQVDAVLSAVSALTITSSAFIVSINATFDASWFVGGFVESSVAGQVTRRFITAHNNGSGVLTLNLPLPNVSVGDTVTAFPGCDHDNATCNGKFANIDNYGGFPFIPEKNPMDGTSVF